MANFAVAASQETIEKANKIMEIYAQNGDKKEDKEYQEQLRQADKENAKLSIQIEQLQKHSEKLSNKINDSKKEPAPQ